MTKRYVTLRKKLEDLETQLETLHSFTPENPAPAAFAEVFTNKLAFFRTLLDAETASRPSKPRHLAHISRRFDELGDHFHAWLAGAVGDEDADDASTCSCTESCLNDDGEAAVFEPEGTEIVAYNAETVSLRDWHEEEKDEEFSDCLDAERIAPTRGRNRRVFVGLVVVVVIGLFGWSEYVSREERFERFLVPT